ncbi:hypothetical protein [Pseudorhodoferax sp. Leaf267]|uniref:hypothetical protein n=1 Tax=Pseudorhodoferax sp. Leaf267 TaxID=1736316 RepID=UPI0009E70AA2|nr:hypothetical protein [Pseudorhodoferax sp. Leaf267]
MLQTAACAQALDVRVCPAGPWPEPALCPAALDAMPSLWNDPECAAAPSDLEADTASPLEWSEEDLVLLHWRLLREVQHLAEPDTPLEEKLDTLRWVFTERAKDGQPFSFVSCLRVVGCSPLSPLPYCGLVDPEEVRDRIRAAVKPWLRETLLRYPVWVREAVLDHPDWIAARLAANPQWLNEETRRIALQGDLFA